LVELSDIDRFREEGFCGHFNCSRNENGYCYFMVEENDCVIDSEGRCFDACIYTSILSEKHNSPIGWDKVDGGAGNW